MNSESVKRNAIDFIIEIGDTFNITDSIMVKNIALFTIDKILFEQPTYRYWETYDDEQSSAITYWNEMKSFINSFTIEEINLLLMK